MLRRTYIDRSNPLRKLIISLVIFLFVCFNYSVLFFNEETIRTVATEDGIIEYLGALYFFITSILCFTLFRLIREGNDLRWIRTNRNIFYLVLGMAFLFAAGEEISWGQRIFELSVPQKWEAINIQKELNIHNLILFQKSSGKHMPFFSLTSMNTWFTVFSLGFCFFIPLLIKFSIKISKLIKQVGLPVVPFELGIIFLLTYLMYTILKFHLFNDSMTIRWAVAEIRESTWAFLYLVIAISWIMKEKSPYYES